MINTRAFFIKSATAAGLFAGSMALTAGVANAGTTPNWDAVAECESGGNWQANTGNGEFGGLQFKMATWQRFGGTGSPAAASRSKQIEVANRVLAVQGLAAWPECGSEANLPISGKVTKNKNNLNTLIAEIVQAAAGNH